jgi:hypothetical protein
MDEQAWDQLIGRIANGVCTPFLGAGASWPVLPLGGDIAARWAASCDYPLEDAHDLARVAQYLAIDHDAMYPKERIQAELAELGPPDFTAPTDPHALLADLPLPLYITTNYDDFMIKALRDRGRDPVQEICKWNGAYNVKQHAAFLGDDPTHRPTVANPVVFHLHGRFGIPESMVLTEDDYLDFLIALSERRDELMPHQILGALSSTSLIFVGYSLADWDFRVLHRGLVVRGEPSLRRLSVTVQLKRTDAMASYLDKYFRRMEVSVYWGDASSFAKDLRAHWERHQQRG